MSCLILQPAPECGPSGICEVNSSTCICEEGFIQSLEFNYYFIDDVDSPEQGICYHHKVTFRVLYALAAFSTVITLLLMLIQAAKYQPFEQTKKWTIYYICLVCYLVATVYRSIYPDEVFGISVVFTFFFANAIGGVAIMFHQTQWTSTNVNAYVKRFQSGESFAKLWDIAIAQLLWISCFVPRDTALILVRLFFAGTFLREIQFVALGVSFLRRYLVDLEKIARFKGNMNENDKISEIKDIEEWIQSHNRRIKKVRESLIAFSVSGFLNIVLPLFWEFWLVAVWSYLIPIMCIQFCYGGINYYYRRAMVRRRRRLRPELDRLKSSHGAAGRNDFETHIQASGEIVRADQGNQSDVYEEDELI